MCINFMLYIKKVNNLLAKASMSVLFWFRSDLRLFDNTSLFHACEQNQNVKLIYVYDEENLRLGGASKWWLHQSLQSLSQDIANLGGVLNIYQGDTRGILERVISEQNITRIFWNRRYEPDLVLLDTDLKKSFQDRGIHVETHNASLLFEPFEITSKSTKKPFQVFTPFWKHCLERGLERSTLKIPQNLSSERISPLHVRDLNLLPKHPYWADGLDEMWVPGEKAAHARLDEFLERALLQYKGKRDLPSVQGTSKLSPHLHFGEISVGYIVQRVQKCLFENPSLDQDAHHFLSEIGWREFSHHLLYHIPDFETVPLRKEFLAFPWEDNQTYLKAWQQGQTGFPIVDAGMRELWKTGWMHNRVRMIVASFLVKDLLIHWREGADWFMDTLVDADRANNTASWQWVSGCGADAAPYFRIFNPILQGEKFDPRGAYVRAHIPELARMPDQYIHKPWLASKFVLEEAGVKLGKNYPYPIVDHDVQRKKALSLFKGLKN